MCNISRTDQKMLDIRSQILYLRISSNPEHMAHAFRLAANTKTQETVWIVDKNGEQLVMNPIQVCAYYRKKYASDVKKVTI
jgi:hypothetical protein